MKLKENYIDAYLLIIVGLIFTLLPILTNKGGSSLSGLAVALIALAYMSAKYRRVNILMITTFRIGYEFLTVVASLFIVLMMATKIDSLLLIEIIPLTVWLLAFVGYVVLNAGNRENDTIEYKSKGGNSKGDTNVSSTEFFGSSLAIFLGALYSISGLNAMALASKASGNSYAFVTGLVIILGAIAYKSAKKRKLKLKPNSLMRIGLEVVAVILILVPILLLISNNGINKFIAENPFPFLLHLWSLLAYLYIVTSSYIKK